MLPTSLRLGRRSKLVLAPPKARCKASRSAGEGAKARKNKDSFVEDEDEDIIEVPMPVGLRLSNDGSEWYAVAGGAFDRLNSLASGLRPFFGLSLDSVGNHLLFCEPGLY